MAREYAETTPARAVSEKPRAPLGNLTTRFLVTETEPLYAGEGGESIGQLVDQRLEQLLNPFSGQEQPAGWVAPVIHSITIELPHDD